MIQNELNSVPEIIRVNPAANMINVSTHHNFHVTKMTIASKQL
jgi:hypothetical protein